jgi:hypothetical protein
MKFVDHKKQMLQNICASESESGRGKKFDKYVQEKENKLKVHNRCNARGMRHYI